jgi:hypothetical protein
MVGSIAYTALESDELKLAVSSLMVKLRLPVVAVIEDLVTCCGSGSSGLVRGRGEGESGTTNNGVNMGRESTGRHNGVTSELSQRRAVDSEELSLSSHGSSQGSQGGLLKSHDVGGKKRLV